MNIFEDDKSEYGALLLHTGVENSKANLPSQEINGVVIYTTSSNSGKYAGEPRYVAYIYNKDLNIDVILSSPDSNETVKMASSLKFN